MTVLPGRSHARGGADRKTRRNELPDRTCISDRLGDQTIDVIETSETKGLNGSWTRSTRKNARKLLTPDELGRIPSDRCIYLLRGIPPFFSQRR